MAAPDARSPIAATMTNQNGMDLPFLEAASFWSNIAVVALTVLAAIAGIFALYFSSRLGDLKDTDFEKFRLDSTAKITIAESEAAKANERAEEARLETAKIREKLAPRTLSDDQQDRIAENLKQFAGTEFRASVFQNDPEALGILYAVLEAFRNAGWIRRNPGRSSPVVMGTPYGTVGITYASGMSLHAPPTLEKVALEVGNILRAEGLEIELNIITNTHNSNPERIHIEIGEKPRF